MVELKYKNWNEITVDVFDKLKALHPNTGEDVIINQLNDNIDILSVLCECDVDDIADLSASKFNELVRQITFLDDMPKVKIQEVYIINGHKYRVFLEIKDMTMSQYIDFQTLMKDQEKNFKKLLACFLLPEGKKYCEGYDITEVINDIGKMSIVDANSVMFFFALLYRSLTKVMLNCSIKDLKKIMKKEKNKVEKIKIGRAIVKMKEAMTLVENGDGFIM